MQRAVYFLVELPERVPHLRLGAVGHLFPDPRPVKLAAQADGTGQGGRRASPPVSAHCRKLSASPQPGPSIPGARTADNQAGECCTKAKRAGQDSNPATRCLEASSGAS